MSDKAKLSLMLLEVRIQQVRASTASALASAARSARPKDRTISDLKQQNDISNSVIDNLKSEIEFLSREVESSTKAASSAELLKAANAVELRAAATAATEKLKAKAKDLETALQKQIRIARDAGAL